MKSIRTKKPFEATVKRRITAVLLFFLIALGALLSRLFSLQIVRHQEFLKLAAEQHRDIEEFFPQRGDIFMQDKNKNNIPLALKQIESTLAASPRAVKNPEEATAFLAQAVRGDKESLFKKLSQKDDSYEVLAKKVEREIVQSLAGRLPEGVFFEEARERIYPHGTLGAHVTGFVSKETRERKGQYGLERFYEKELSGSRQALSGAENTGSFLFALGRRVVRPPRDGSNIILTIDYNIQLKTEEVLTAMKEKWQAARGLALVLEPSTGKIRALAARPAYDPNEFSKERDFSVFLNPVVEARYEFGSVIKPIMMAAGIEEKLIHKDSTYTDTGEVKLNGAIIKNFDEHAYGLQTMTQVLEKSLNTGAMYVARLLGHERQLEYLKRFGFNEKTGVDLPGEVNGNVSNLENGREVDFATASFGQGIAMTPLELARAIGAIANGGELMKPYVVEKIKDDSGNEMQKESEVKRRVISKETAEEVTTMLVSAVRNGFENRAGIKGYFVAGKTGTAQIPKRESRGYYTDRVIHTFVGYAPAFHPRFLVLLELNEPKGNRFAANTLTPAFHDLAEYILHYYEVPPDEK